MSSTAPTAPAPTAPAPAPAPAAVTALQWVCVRLVAAWLAEESEALTPLVVAAFPTLLAVARDSPELFVLLLPGLRLALDDADVRAAAIEHSLASLCAQSLAAMARDESVASLICDILSTLMEHQAAIATPSLLQTIVPAASTLASLTVLPTHGWLVAALALRVRTTCTSNSNTTVLSRADDALLVGACITLASPLSSTELTQDDEEIMAVALQDLAELLSEATPPHTLPPSLEKALRAFTKHGEASWSQDAATAVLSVGTRASQH